jgi:hypothetical protein
MTKCLIMEDALVYDFNYDGGGQGREERVQ